MSDENAFEWQKNKCLNNKIKYVAYITNYTSFRFWRSFVNENWNILTDSFTLEILKLYLNTLYNKPIYWVYKNVYNCFCFDLITQWKRWTQKRCRHLSKQLFKVHLKLLKKLLWYKNNNWFYEWFSKIFKL